MAEQFDKKSSGTHSVPTLVGEQNYIIHCMHTFMKFIMPFLSP